MRRTSTVEQARRRVKKNNGQRSKGRGTVTDPAVKLSSTHVIRSVFDDSIIVSLHYNDPAMSRNNASALLCSWRYRMNSVYDPDPLVGSASVSGFTEWSSIYSTYRVIEFKYEITIANQEAYPLQVSVCPTQFDLGANSTAVPEFGEAKYGRQTIISTTGGQDRCRMIGKINLTKFFGPSYLYDATFNSAVTSNPSTLLYFNIGLYTPSVLVKGVVTSVRLTYVTQFYRRQNVFT